MRKCIIISINIWVLVTLNNLINSWELRTILHLRTTIIFQNVQESPRLWNLLAVLKSLQKLTNDINIGKLILANWDLNFFRSDRKTTSFFLVKIYSLIFGSNNSFDWQDSLNYVFMYSFNDIRMRSPRSYRKINMKRCPLFVHQDEYDV